MKLKEKMNKTLLRIITLFYFLFPLLTSAIADNPFITVASTTSTANSGLFDHILPIFYDKTRIKVRIVAVGTGRAIKLAQHGDADVLLVHHAPSEEKFVAEGYGIKRFPVMYNDFIIVGPRDAPAKIKNAKSIDAVLRKIAENQLPFTSRGDDSGTNKKELSLWRAISIDAKLASGTWYRETGSGMGATLNIASGMRAYSLTDRATWLNFKNKGDLKILFEGSKKLFNQYGIILVNPKKFPHIKKKPAQKFIHWILSHEGQEAIGAYKIQKIQAFFPNAKITKKE
jgi:tungstate transport system substrate-binding protein